MCLEAFLPLYCVSVPYFHVSETNYVCNNKKRRPNYIWALSSCYTLRLIKVLLCVKAISLLQSNHKITILHLTICYLKKHHQDLISWMHEDVIQTKDLLHLRFVWLNHYLQQHEDVNLFASYCKIKTLLVFVKRYITQSSKRDTVKTHSLM